MDITEYLRVFRRYWLVIVATSLVGLFGAVALATILPQSYRAEALLYLTVQSKDSSLYERSQYALQRVASYPELAWTPAVLSPVIEQLGLPTTVDALRSTVTVTNPTGTVFVQVDADSENATEAANIANAVANSLAREASDLESASSSTTDSVELVTATQAEPPTKPSSPPRIVIAVLGVLLGFALGAIIALVLYRRRRSLPALADLEASIGVPVIARLPRGLRLPRASRPRASAPGDGKAPGIVTATIGDTPEPLRLARLGILGLSRGEVPGVLLLVPVPDSRRQREVVRAVAGSLTEGGRSVALFETLPDATSGPRHAQHAGLAEMLGTGAAAKDAIAAALNPAGSAPGTLTVVGPGDPSVAPRRRTLAARSLTLTRQLRKIVDVTVLSATERSVPADVVTLTTSADVVVLVIDATAIDARELERTVAELALHATPVDAAILVGGDPHHDADHEAYRRDRRDRSAREQRFEYPTPLSLTAAGATSIAGGDGGSGSGSVVSRSGSDPAGGSGAGKARSGERAVGRE